MRDEEGSTAAWIASRLGWVLGSDGCGGTGVFIDMEDGQLALLTARHVVIDCILTGEMTVGRLDRAGRKSSLPDAIRIDNCSDAAILLVDRNTFYGDTVPYAEWTRPIVELSDGMLVIVSGVVGKWKVSGTAVHHFSSTKILHLDTQIVNADRQGKVICHVDEKETQLPDTFEGMSGGPCVSEDRRLLGLNTAELRRRYGANDGEILITPLSRIGLFKPIQIGVNPTIQRQVTMAFWAISDNGPRVCVSVAAQLIFSQGEPDAPPERLGSIAAMRIVTPKSASLYSMNCRYTFPWTGRSAGGDLYQQFEEGLGYFLLDIGFKLDSPVQFF